MLQRSNPFRGPVCTRDECFVCESQGKGRCDKNGVTYEIECRGCSQEEGKRKVYYGETARNAFTRGKEHLKDLDRRSAGSVLWRHCRETHEGSIPDFRMNVKACYGKDAMLRQIAEAVLIGNAEGDELLNNKTEWNYVGFPQIAVRKNGREEER